MGEGFGVLLGVLVGTKVSVGARDGDGLDVTEAVANAVKVGLDVNEAVAVAVKLGVGVGVDIWIPAQKPPVSE